MTVSANWKNYNLGELAEYINGRAFKPEDWGSEGLPIIRIQNLNDPTKPFNYFSGSFAEKHKIGVGDVLLSWSGTPGTSFGCFIWNRGEALLNQHIFKVKIREDLVLPEYFVYATNSRLREMIALSHGAAGLRHITKAKLETIELPVPHLDEQRRIVARIKECLERIDEIEGLRHQATRDAANIEFACFHDALLDGIQQKGWPVLTLGDMAKSFRYGTSAKAHTQSVGLPVLRMGNIRGGYLDLSDLKYIELPDAEAVRYKLNFGDVLINRTNSLELVGKAATFTVAEGEWVYASYLVKVEVDRERALPEFVTAVINSSMGRNFVLRTARRAIGMVNLNAKEMAKFPIPLPPLEEQEKIVARLKAARIPAKELRASMVEPEIGFLRNSVLQKAFAGEL